MEISVSAADCWQTCNRKYYYRYKMNVGPIGEAVELTFGKAWHARREGVVNNFGLSGADLVKLDVLDAAYIKHWAKEPLGVIAHEEAFELPGFDGTRLDPDVIVRGRIDARAAGRLIEYKTTGSYIDPGSIYWERVLDDRQIQTYLGALWSAGHTFSEVCYDVARKPMIKRKAKETVDEFGIRMVETIAENPDGYFQRRTFHFDSEQVADTWRDLHTVARQIVDAGDELTAYPKSPRSCMAYNRACEFLPTCRRESSISDTRLYKVRKP